MALPIVLYSANSWLAYKIGERYYGGEHYAWCAPVFDGRTSSAGGWYLPPTSSPAEIYSGLREEVRRGDRHSAKIDQNKIGIIYGASVKRRTGIVSEKQEKEIALIVEAAERADFRPLLYVIPYPPVAHLVKEVHVKDRAHPLSSECVIEALDRKLFDVIEEL
jgi:hypothetical protein